MITESLYILVGLVGFTPLIAVSFREGVTPRPIMLALLITAGFGVGCTFIHHIQGSWRADLESALLATIVATIALAAVISLFRQMMNQYLFLLAPYLFILFCLAIALTGSGETQNASLVMNVSIPVHIGFSLATYGMLTLAAIAALGATLKERALKSRQTDFASVRLPAVADSESFVIQLLTGAEILLLAGLMSGSILSYNRAGVIFPLDHKTLLSVLAFIVIGLLIVLHRSVGIRGRMAGRLVLIAWILLTLGYPGVKFVTELLIS